MAKKFIPYPGKVEIKPITDGSAVSDGNSFLEMGEVIALGADVVFLKVGDIVFFEEYGMGKTPLEEDGTQHFVIESNSKLIHGKYSSAKRK